MRQNKPHQIIFILLLLDSIFIAQSLSAQPRIVISSDFPPTDVVMSGGAADHTSDPDDVQSMVRFLLYTNEFTVEGLIASSATYANIAKKKNILDMLDLYDQVDENLRKHDGRYPTADYLRSVTFQGRSGTWGKTVSNNIGSGKDSEASEAIIQIVDKPDSRPVWFCFWGDCSNLAQAIWKVQNTRSATELKTFLSKIRIHQIAHQDDTIDWLLDTFPDLFIIYSQNTYMGMFGGSNDALGNLTWLNSNIRQNHGPLGAIYPPAAMGVDGLKEGDTPSFLYLVSAVHGLNNSEDPTQESWGGQYKRLGTTNHWVDGPGASSVSKWKSKYQSEFALLSDWMLPVTSIEQSNLRNIPQCLELDQNYPNPFNPITKIKYAISKGAMVTLKIINVLGEEVSTLISEFKNAGEYSALFNGKNLPSGIYFCRLEAGGFSITKKMILLK